ncbi:tail fiber domain-containing protein [Tichowtungia aerotolerans]|uniref:Peptidase S74 domain-containing protein n=1 Tax=Tichowtungia aerotolerans TaxID=2697043 RepID=A0A6P1M9Q1_9BACT|nr:tail fiber domain-containing protein [Tichowtungia aerotolerans]QHI68808.1 hypothetical protein GT409_04875 [Tichowtungia aerotolerans]
MASAGYGLAQIGNTTYGTGAGNSLSTGDYDTLIGYEAGRVLSDGLYNTFMGFHAGRNQTTSSDNTFIGALAGRSNVTGSDNVFVGKWAGLNSTGTDNTFIGTEAGAANTSGGDNTFIGEEAGTSNTEGFCNTFVGEDAGYSNTIGDDNVAVGKQALRSSTEGKYNTAVGSEAGWDLTTAIRNTMVGNSAGTDIGEGTANTLIGDNAGAATENADFNTFVGVLAGHDNNRGSSTVNANRNTALGTLAGYTNREGEDNVWIGAFSDSGQWLPGYNHDMILNDLAVGTQWMPAIFSARVGGDSTIYRITVIGGFASAGEDDSVALGYNARADEVNSVVVGSGASGTGLNDITIGTSASSTHSGAITIGYQAVSHGADIAVIGNATTAGWHPGADAVTSLGATNYRFSTVYSQSADILAAAGAEAEVNLWADNGAVNADKWKISASDGGLELASYATGGYVSGMSLSTDGNMMVAGDVTVTSDRRLKRDIESVDNALDMVSRLDGKTFRWKEESGRDENRHYGLIAQEVEAVVPELVAQTDSPSGELSVNYQGAVPILINAVKELREQNLELVAAIDQLKRQMTELQENRR